jgi:imidazolonepropionase-like amidohydrolase
MRVVVAAALLAACVPRQPVVSSPAAPATPVARETSARPVAIVHATIWSGDAKGTRLQDATLVMREGRIVALGKVPVPPDAQVIDAGGHVVTPGLIDAHSHLGVYASPEVSAHADGNEATAPNTAEVNAEHGFWPQDPGLDRALSAGVTSLLVLPGSANLIGGRGFAVKNRPARSAAGMRFPGAPYVLKMACGENPKRVYQEKGPSTRMGNLAGDRAAFAKAEKYRREWDAWLAKKEGEVPERDLQLESLAEVLRGKAFIQNHCYRADEMAQMLDLAREFGFRIRAFHHATEAYKVADLLARDSVAAAIWADWWGFKMESLDGIPQNAALLEQAGARAIIHSDSEEGIQRLNQEAAKALYAGRNAGINITREQAIRWLTINPAWALGIDSTTGTLEAGKAADVVLWSGDPFSVYSKAERVYNEGWLVFDRADPRNQRSTDFNLGPSRPGVGQ